MLATTLILLFQADKAAFEILGESLPPKKIEAVSSSPKGEWLLGASMGTNPRSIYVMNRTETAAYPYPQVRLVGVLDDGSAVGMTTQPGPSGTARTTYLMNQDGVQPIYPDHDAGSQETWFEGWGVGPDQAILGEVVQTPNPPPYPNRTRQLYGGGYAAIWKAGSWVRLGTAHSADLKFFEDARPAFVQIPLSDGGIGMQLIMTYESGRGPSYHGSGTCFYGLFRSGRFDLLPMPNGFGVVAPTASTPDGRTIVGQAVGVTIIWRDGSPYVKKYPGVGKIWLKGVSNDGKLAVGFWANDHQQTAILWDEDKGARSLAELLKERKVDVPTGWTLTDAVGVSPDGKTIFGTAVSKEKTRPFRVQLPDLPSSEL